MNKMQFEKLETAIDIIDETNLIDKSDRTLLYGYTSNRETWHVYMQNKQIFVLFYGGFDSKPLSLVHVQSNMDYVPDKRLYPERCDFEFCRLLMGAGITLPFTTWTDEGFEETYYGLTM